MHFYHFHIYLKNIDCRNISSVFGCFFFFYKDTKDLSPIFKCFMCGRERKRFVNCVTLKFYMATNCN